MVIDAKGQAAVRPFLIHLGVEHTGQAAVVILDDTHAAVFIDGRLIRHLQLDHSRPYQPSGRPRDGTRRQLP